MLATCYFSWGGNIGKDDDVFRSGKVLPAVNDPCDSAHQGDDCHDDDDIVHGRSSDRQCTWEDEEDTGNDSEDESANVDDGPELSKSEGPDGIASWLKDLVTAEQHKSDGDDVTDLNENDRRGKNGIESSRRSEEDQSKNDNPAADKRDSPNRDLQNRVNPSEWLGDPAEKTITSDGHGHTGSDGH